MRRRRKDSSPVEMQMGPMIDMVFLLLVFFMVTAKPLKPETDINIGLPGAASQDEPLELPDEQRILIHDDGTVVLNEQTLAAPKDRRMEQLHRTLYRLKESSKLSQSELLVTLVPDDATTHQRIVDVLDVCAAAGIVGVTFDDPPEGGGS